MRSFLRKQFIDGRIKAIAFIQFILVALVIYYNFGYTNPNYRIIYMVIGVFLLLFSIEEYILKKSNYKFWLILSVICGGIALNNF